MRASFGSVSGRRLRAAVAGFVLAAAACDGSGPAELERGTALSLTVTAAAGVAADQGRVQIEGAARRTVNIAPGGSAEIELPAGTYSVALEGLTGTTVTGYWERSNVTVTEGQLTSLTATLANFAGATPAAAATATVGQPISVSWAPVTGAASYDLEASTSTSFATTLDQRNVSGTSAQITATTSGTVYFRVRPRTRFNGTGSFGSPSSGTLLRVAVQAVEVQPQDLILEVGQNRTYTATLRGPSGEVLTGRSVAWQSTNPAVAAINASSGQVTAQSVGTTTIRATSEGVTGVSVLTVVTPGVATVEVSPPQATIPLGGTVDLNAMARSAAGTVLTLPVTWSSADETIATVNNTGLVTGTGGGVVDIFATVDGVRGSASVTVDAGAPPTVVDYQVTFLPVVSLCGAGFRDFRTTEALLFADGDGNMDPGRTFLEPLSGAFTTIQSQFREEGATEWRQVAYEKQWAATGGSSGSAGGLQALGSTCWTFDMPSFVDYRVRVRDANGNWSAWRERRLKMPAQVIIGDPDSSPSNDQFSINPGGSVQLTAQVRDADGLPVPGDPINWSSYTGPDHASVSPTGVYSVVGGTVGGLDWVAARAGYVHGVMGAVSAFQPGSWFAPGWLTGVALSSNATRLYRLRVYQGREYIFRTADGTNPTGDLDLYIRFGQAPTLSVFDERDFSTGNAGEITWTAAADGVLWILLHAYADANFTAPVANATFTVSGDRVPPRGVESLATPGPEGGNGRLGPPADAPRDLLLAPWTRDRGPGSTEPTTPLPTGGR